MRCRHTDQHVDMIRSAKMNPIAILPSATGGNTLIWHAPDADLRALVEEQRVDVAVMSTEHGFSPLGAASDFLSEALDVPQDEIKRLADWNRFENELVTLVALRSRREHSSLRGLILAPGETARCYSKFATPIYGRPHRDFYYNVVYEAVAYAAARWDARMVGMSHLSASGRFHQDIAMCTAEATAQVNAGNGRYVESLVFFGCCITSSALQGISQLTERHSGSIHRPVATVIEPRDQVDIVHLSWPHFRSGAQLP